MQRTTKFSLVATGLALTAATVVAPGTAVAAPAAPQGDQATTPVIVIYKDGAPKTFSAYASAKNVKRFSLVNGFAATVSGADAARLAADPSVAAVVPDTKLLKRPKNPFAEPGPSTKGTLGKAAAQQICPPAGKTMLAPEALSVTHTNSDDPGAKTARSLGFTGKGVKVAYIADNTDVKNVDFVRKDGSPVFADYKDFTGEGVQTGSGVTEAMLDASSIAAQGVQNHQIPTQPAGCDIRVEGVAPGASLVGLRVFPDNAFPTTSAIVEAIDYAVSVDHVDVLNESFGYNPFPDTGSQDVVRLFNDRAVDRGVTVTASSGDAGSTNTQGSPSTDPKVISAGASTTLQAYAQGVRYGYAAFGATGWNDDNISALSSSGVDQAGRTPNLVAPGDLNYVACNCAGTNGLGISGGTSESAPLSAGAAALVIEAYRSTHHGAKPSPALIKQILTSTADDLGHPAAEQGTGRLNTYKAVLAALSAKGGKATGSTLLVDQAELRAVQDGGSKASWSVKVTNTGATGQTVHLSDRALGGPEHVQRASVSLSDSTGQHTPVYNYQKVPFTVSPGADRLDAEIAYQTASGAVRLALFDPTGKYTAYSLPQGVGNYGHVDVRYPMPGNWTAFVFAVNSASGGAPATAKFQASTERYHSFGKLSTGTLKLAPGQSKNITFSTTLPGAAGDSNGSVVLNAGAAGQTSIPVVLRSLVKGSFQGVLTGGNGRQTNIGQAAYYQFDVKKGQRDVEASVALSADPGDNAILLLIDPQGQTVAFGTNRVATSYNQATGAGSVNPSREATVYHRNPAPGRWTLAVNFAGPTVGDRVATPYAGQVSFNKVDVKASGLPSGGTLAAGKPVTVKIKVHNTGSAPANFFLDPRLNKTVDLPLAPVQKATGVALPLANNQPVPAWLVPAETTRLHASAKASEPIVFDWAPMTGDPDLLSTVGTTPQGWFARNPVTAGVWGANPAIVGAFGSTAPPAGTADLAMVAQTLAFDPSATSPASDLWQQSAKVTNANLTLFTVQPGQTRELPLTLTPTGAKGTVVRGTAFVDTLIIGDTPSWNAENFALPSNFAASLPYIANGSELAAFPYTYKIG